jgi:hypothetical protein
MIIIYNNEGCIGNLEVGYVRLSFCLKKSFIFDFAKINDFNFLLDILVVDIFYSKYLLKILPNNINIIYLFRVFF